MQCEPKTKEPVVNIKESKKSATEWVNQYISQEFIYLNIVVI